MDSMRSLRWVSRKLWRSAVSLYSSSAIMFTGPICSMRCLQGAAGLFLGEQLLRRAGGRSQRRRAAPAASTLTSARQLASRCSRSECSLASSLERLARSSRNWSSASAAGLELRFHLRQLLAQRLRLRGDGLREGQRLGARGSQLLLPCGQFGALGDALLALRRRRSPLLLDGQHAPLQVGMEPVDALEGSFSAAAPLFKAGELGRDLRRFLLQASRFWRSRVSCACSSSRPASACACSASRRDASSRFWSIDWRLASQASLLRAACIVHSCRRRSMRCASPSICFSAAPRLAASRLGHAALFAAWLQAARSARRWCAPGSAASVSACARPASSTASRLSASRNSRFSASGPSLAGLPPVTVALWKHSPPGVRK